VKAAINIVAASSTFTAPEARGDVYQVVISESIVMPSGRKQFRKSVCASDLNAWFDRNQRLTN